ncbi:non-ribosomal peptide synthetase [Streptomyces sp. ISL-66]|uniref:AMP-binding protein n=1 Tax=Streptomyces sp. ISL-66 TaxID=2819186 RepID=UPI001BEB1326|nr:non-ribosomal peptide synthetase [Streptomyces sp. ISL-66]MBT2471283.1 non-ribosomal peptide synthetase [Streptomyces sp. ISL-66]
MPTSQETSWAPAAGRSVAVQHAARADVGGLLVRAAAEFPAHGVRYRPAERPLAHTLQTYPQLLDASLRLLHSLRQAGVRREHVVVLLLERPEEFVPALWACLLGGITVCPLTPSRDDPERWAARLGHVNALLDGPLVVTDRRTHAELPAVHGLAVATIEDLAASSAGTDPRTIAGSGAGPDDVALLLLTSGSTGASKAVRLTHGNLLASLTAKAEVQGLTSADVTLNWISYDHVAALLEAHLLPVSVGAVQLQVTPDCVLADPLHFLELIDAHRVTMTVTPNFLLGLINKALDQLPPTSGPDPDPALRPGPHPDPVPPRSPSLSLDLSCLRHIVSGGEANPVATGTGFLDRLAPYGLHRGALWPAFGMIETCAGSIYNRAFPDADLGAEFAAVGQPVDGLRIRVVTEEGGGTPLAAGEVGEVQLAGPMITDGYWNDEEATRGAFTADGWFRTGDLGRLADGRLTLVGRIKDSIVVNGVNHHSHDLEAVLEGLVGVRKSFVTVFPTRPPGSDTEQLAIVFAAGPEVAADEEALRRLLTEVANSAVLHWGLRPALVLPLPEDAFPKTGPGEIRRSLVRRRLESGDYSAQVASVRDLVTRRPGGQTTPTGVVEETLAELYGDLLRAEPSTISATAGFFDLGGTSLDVLRLKHLISLRFPGTELSVPAILTSPGIRELAVRIEEARSDRDGGPAYDPLVALQAGGDKTPLFCVHSGVGEVLVFVNLAKYFVHERPFYALRARGFDPGEKSFTSFAEMTRTYAEAIRAKQPHGPYAIAGYSFGAAVAFEVAKHLEEQGESVDFLGSFNLAPHIKGRMDELDFVETAVNLAMFLGLVSEERARTLPAELRPLGRRERLGRLIEIASPERLAELDLDLERFTAWADLADGLTGLGRTYRPAGSVDRMSVFYAAPLRGNKQDWLDNELKRWADFTREAPRYIDVPGEHHTLMGPKHVPVFQSLLRAELDRAMSGADSARTRKDSKDS